MNKILYSVVVKKEDSDPGVPGSTPCAGTNFQPMWGGRGTRPGRIMSNREHRTPIPHRRLHLYYTFTGLQDAHTIYLALNRTCPRCHLHTWNNETLIPIIGITVQCVSPIRR